MNEANLKPIWIVGVTAARRGLLARIVGRLIAAAEWLWPGSTVRRRIGDTIVHVALLRGDEVIEAIPMRGVVRRPLADVLIQWRADGRKVWRREIDDPVWAAATWRNSGTYVGVTDYDVAAAVAAGVDGPLDGVLTRLGWRAHGTFCSGLIAKCAAAQYQQAPGDWLRFHAFAPDAASEQTPMDVWAWPGLGDEEEYKVGGMWRL